MLYSLKCPYMHARACWACLQHFRQLKRPSRVVPAIASRRLVLCRLRGLPTKDVPDESDLRSRFAPRETDNAYRWAVDGSAVDAESDAGCPGLLHPFSG